MKKSTASVGDFRAQAQMALTRCGVLANFSEEPDRITRTFLSAPMHDCHRMLAEWMAPLGVQIRIDAAGNFRALYPAASDGAPRLLIGSHLDTVPDAGAFDGILGVILGIGLLDALHGERLPFAIEIVGFSEEEGVRFGKPFLGSRALVGALNEDLLAIEDRQGISVRAAIEHFGLKPEEIPQARLGDDILGYVEFHIEQGPVLEDLGLPLAVVESVVGQSRFELTFTGRANHAGTTPMHLRRDAIAGAAEWVCAVERGAQLIPGLVATVGAVTAKPGAINVIAGEAAVTLDVRHGDDGVRAGAAETLVRLAEEVAARRGLTVDAKSLLDQPAVEMDASLVGHVEQALGRAGCEPHRMASGAGHDAMILAGRFPAAMIFIRTPGGISHNPKETVLVEDVEKALEAGMHLLEVLASTPGLNNRRMERA